MLKLIKKLAVLKVIKRKKVVLSSGLKSDFYIDIKKAYGSPEVFKLLTEAMSGLVARKATCIAASGYGGIPIGTAVSQKLNLPLTLIREKPKGYGTNSLIEGYVPGPRDRAAVIDDVFTTGNSIRKIINTLHAKKVKIAGKYVIVNRSGKAKISCRYLLDVSTLL